MNIKPYNRSEHYSEEKRRAGRRKDPGILPISLSSIV